MFSASKQEEPCRSYDKSYERKNKPQYEEKVQGRIICQIDQEMVSDAIKG